jgi:hypothetical protein
MQKSHESGVATHIGPESCGAAREGGVEALTGDTPTSAKIFMDHFVHQLNDSKLPAALHPLLRFSRTSAWPTPQLSPVASPAA